MQPSLTSSTPKSNLVLSIFVLFWSLAEGLRDGQNNLGTPSYLAQVEAVKLAFSLIVYFWKRRTAHVEGYNGVAQEERDLEDLSPERRQASNGSPGRPSHARPGVLVPVGSSRSTVSIVTLAFLYTCCNYMASTAQAVTDPFAPYVAGAITTLSTLAFLRVFCLRSFSALHWHAVLLQFCGLFVVRTSVINTSLPPSSLSLLLGLALFTSVTLVLTDHIYKSHASPSFSIFKITLFASGLLMNLTVLFIQRLFGVSSSEPASERSLIPIGLPFIDSFRDIAALWIICNIDAAVEGVMASLAPAFLLFGTAALSMLHSVEVYAGCILVFFASGSYIRSYMRVGGKDEVEVNPKSDRRRRIAASLAVASISLSTLYASIHARTLVTSPQPLSSSYLLTHPVCLRKPLPEVSNTTRRSYHAFDNVLLIVFFSHARYDGNLDYYREVYAEFFPNMLFIGPGSREDKGFSHSYDVLVDSYQADEDLSDPSFYKMAGRMAHHMLYTAMREHPCYSGYLWAPFDTLLNIPRLQQFDQNRFWYHSPWGTYVSNPAIGETKIMNETIHAPPANISPDPAVNATEGWRGWDPDWWWGDPHVGLAVCMQAFEKVPLQMRERLASFTSGTTRLIGGSADTVYIPGKHRDAFLDVLGTFLETDCFLEIATPTAVHLVVPPSEEILFVDHWWIWRAPFDATFVRRKWAEGFEVDTFHTFHWGDIQANGAWRPNPDNIADVRILLAESAERQGVDWHS